MQRAVQDRRAAAESGMRGRPPPTTPVARLACVRACVRVCVRGRAGNLPSLLPRRRRRRQPPWLLDVASGYDPGVCRCAAHKPPLGTTSTLAVMLPLCASQVC
jgi:hypothetical protein